MQKNSKVKHSVSETTLQKNREEKKNNSERHHTVQRESPKAQYQRNQWAHVELSSYKKGQDMDLCFTHMFSPGPQGME